MAIISATSIIRSLSIFHLTVAYFLLTSPTTIADHNLVFVLGAAMDLVSLSFLFSPLPSFSPPRSLHSLFLTSQILLLAQLHLRFHDTLPAHRVPQRRPRPTRYRRPHRNRVVAARGVVPVLDLPSTRAAAVLLRRHVLCVCVQARRCGFVGDGVWNKGSGSGGREARVG